MPNDFDILFEDDSDDDSSVSQNNVICAMCGAEILGNPDACDSCGEPLREILSDYHKQCMWQCGQYLVVRFGTIFPDVCLKTNQPTNGDKHKQTFYWMSFPSVLMQIVISLIPLMFCRISQYLSFVVFLLAFFLVVYVQKSTELKIGISSKLFREMKWKKWLCRLAVLIAFVVIIIVPSLMGIQDSFELFLSLVLFVPLSTWAYLHFASRFLLKQSLVEPYIWIKGVHPDFLAELPAWSRNKSASGRIKLR
ncbi:hypothetical protein MNBD_PLANCTO02-72 [hydrothermal vent metagenome]|uniref:Uncharacterized protein n=1 Tax=hydrothermal vent metagenome TaxID=652676 RepID=A0A3B1DZ37_9ZZZZ